MALKTQLSDQDLLKLLQDTSHLEAARPVSKDHYADFVEFYGLIPGDNNVSKKLVYQIFKNYTLSEDSYRTFGSQISLYIPEVDDKFIKINLETSKLGQILKQLKALHESSNISYSQNIAPIFDFLTENEVEAGNDVKVSLKAFYSLLKKRSKGIKMSVLKTELDKLLTPKVTSKGVMYSVSNSILNNISLDDIKKATDGKKTNKKKSRKVPKSKTRT